MAKKCIYKKLPSLSGKTVAITGSTGGLGRHICRELISLGASLVMLNRNAQKAAALEDELKAEYPNADISHIKLDLTDIRSVSKAAAELEGASIDYLILNAGIFNVPVVKCDTGYNNIFQTNFISQYVLAKAFMPCLKRTNGKIIAVGSLAHTWAKLDELDTDYSTRKGAGKVYGNSKRFLMAALDELVKIEPSVRFTVAHPGITLTELTTHYNRFLKAIVKVGMTVLFTPAKRAARNIVAALFNDTDGEWIGPRVFGIWGRPSIKNLRTIKPDERARIYETAEMVCAELASHGYLTN